MVGTIPTALPLERLSSRSSPWRPSLSPGSPVPAIMVGSPPTLVRHGGYSKKVSFVLCKFIWWKPRNEFLLDRSWLSYIVTNMSKRHTASSKEHGGDDPHSASSRKTVLKKLSLKTKSESRQSSASHHGRESAQSGKAWRGTAKRFCLCFVNLYV